MCSFLTTHPLFFVFTHPHPYLCKPSKGKTAGSHSGWGDTAGEELLDHLGLPPYCLCCARGPLFNLKRLPYWLKARRFFTHQFGSNLFKAPDRLG